MITPVHARLVRFHLAASLAACAMLGSATSGRAQQVAAPSANSTSGAFVDLGPLVPRGAFGTRSVTFAQDGSGLVVNINGKLYRWKRGSELKEVVIPLFKNHSALTAAASLDGATVFGTYTDKNTVSHWTFLVDTPSTGEAKRRYAVSDKPDTPGIFLILSADDSSLYLATGNFDGRQILESYKVTENFKFKYEKVDHGETTSILGASPDGAACIGTMNGHAFLWTVSEKPLNLNTNGIPSGVSAGGNVVVGTDGTHAFRWTKSSGVKGILDLDGANGVSGDGSVIAGRAGSHAAIWTEKGGVQDLGTLGGQYAEALAASADGSIIAGDYIDSAGMVHLFVSPVSAILAKAEAQQAETAAQAKARADAEAGQRALEQARAAQQQTISAEAQAEQQARYDKVVSGGKPAQIYSLAGDLRAEGRPDLALSLYQLLIDKYPDDPYAAKAIDKKEEMRSGPQPQSKLQPVKPKPSGTQTAAALKPKALPATWLADAKTGCKVWDSFPEPGEKVSWSGECVNGFAQGPGTAEWFIGNVRTKVADVSYEAGKGTGKGKVTWINGHVYEGDFAKDRFNGKGLLTLANGLRYEGDFLDGDFSGKGILTYPDKSNYEGDFLQGKKNGKGKMTFPSGVRYEGGFKNDRFDGRGTLTSTNGSRYEGDFVAGQRTGTGVSTLANGDRYDGGFLNGKRNGYGTYTWPRGSRFVGTWKDDEKDSGVSYDAKGKMVATYSNGVADTTVAEASSPSPFGQMLGMLGGAVIGAKTGNADLATGVAMLGGNSEADSRAIAGQSTQVKQPSSQPTTTSQPPAAQRTAVEQQAAVAARQASTGGRPANTSTAPTPVATLSYCQQHPGATGCATTSTASTSGAHSGPGGAHESLSSACANPNCLPAGQSTTAASTNASATTTIRPTPVSTSGSSSAGGSGLAPIPSYASVNSYNPPAPTPAHIDNTFNRTSCVKLIKSAGANTFANTCNESIDIAWCSSRPGDCPPGNAGVAGQVLMGSTWTLEPGAQYPTSASDQYQLYFFACAHPDNLTSAYLKSLEPVGGVCVRH